MQAQYHTVGWRGGGGGARQVASGWEGGAGGPRARDQSGQLKWRHCTGEWARFREAALALGGLL